jgi:hypothetical protein
MSDIDQGQDDNALFRDATEGTTLDKFENPELPKAEPDKDAAKAEPKLTEKPAEKPADKPEDREAIPAWRLREAADRARQAEQENAELRARMQAYERQQPKVPAPDMFENPSAFIRQEVAPTLQEMRDAILQEVREENSRTQAIIQHGAETVQAAYTALQQGIHADDPNVKAVLDAARGSRDPYGVITRWHKEREFYKTTGGDLEAYNKKQQEAYLRDPEFRKRAIEMERNAALQTGQTVYRPAQSKVPNVPSLANFGAGGGDENVSEPSDDQLFRQAVSAKRR